MLTDGPVTVSVLVTVIHFVAIREMSEVRSDKCFFFIISCFVLYLNSKQVKLKQFYGISRGHLWSYYEVMRGILGYSTF